MDSTLNPDTTLFSDYQTGAQQLSMSHSVQTPLFSTLSALQEYNGYATFGRIQTRAYASADLTESHPAPGVYSGLFMGSVDELTVSGAGAGSYLLLDISLSGYMVRQDDTFGNYARALFEATALSLSELEEDEPFILRYDAQFWWTDTAFIENNPAGITFTAYAGQDPAFSALQPIATRQFGGKGFVSIPLDLLDSTFQLSFGARSDASCSETSTAGCLSHSNFGSTALIGNARIVDALGNLVPGASFTSASGYDYITPPGAQGGGSAVPEPASSGLSAAGLVMIALAVRARRRSVRA
ncbi:MAG: PEP-CTERM sorting domain-containing protein [Acidobacteriota bacterium]